MTFNGYQFWNLASIKSVIIRFLKTAHPYSYIAWIYQVGLVLADRLRRHSHSANAPSPATAESALAAAVAAWTLHSPGGPLLPMTRRNEERHEK